MPQLRGLWEIIQLWSVENPIQEYLILPKLQEVHFRTLQVLLQHYLQQNQLYQQSKKMYRQCRPELQAWGWCNPPACPRIKRPFRLCLHKSERFFILVASALLWALKLRSSGWARLARGSANIRALASRQAGGLHVWRPHCRASAKTFCTVKE